MDRFYEILRKSVASHGHHGSAVRAEIYERARVQLEQLIAEAEPPMTPDEARLYRDRLNRAIVEIEDEYTGRNAPAVPEPAAAPMRPRPGGRRAGPRNDPERARPAPGGFERRHPTGSAPEDGRSRRNESRGRRLARLSVPLLLLVAVFGGLVFGAWLLVSTIFAPVDPSAETVVRRLERTGRATLFVGAVTDRLTAPEGTSVAEVPELLGRGAVRMTSSVDKPRARHRTNGVHIALSPVVRTLLLDSTLRATVVARAAPDNPSPKFAIAVSTGGRDTSGWERFELDDTYRAYSVEYSFGIEMNPKRPVVSVIADVKGEGRAVDIREISLQIVPN